jgi:hypothetical protein
MVHLQKKSENDARGGFTPEMRFCNCHVGLGVIYPLRYTADGWMGLPAR